MTQLSNRKNIRLKNYDYSQPRYYFVTICAKDRRCLFGEVQGDEIVLNHTGVVASNNILRIPEHNDYVDMDVYRIMPNHIHMIIIIQARPPYMAALQDRSKAILPKIIQQYKSSVSRHLGTAGMFQPSYYEHIIRNEIELHDTKTYINNNPLKWHEDQYYTK